MLNVPDRRCQPLCLETLLYFSAQRGWSHVTKASSSPLSARCHRSPASHPLVTLQVAVTRMQVQIFRPCGPQTHPLTVPCHKRSPGPPPILYETFCHTSQAHPLCAEKYSIAAAVSGCREYRKRKSNPQDTLTPATRCDAIKTTEAEDENRDTQRCNHASLVGR